MRFLYYSFDARPKELVVSTLVYVKINKYLTIQKKWYKYKLVLYYMYKLFTTIFIAIGLNNASCMKVNFSSLTSSFITVLFKEKEIQKLIIESKLVIESNRMVLSS